MFWVVVSSATVFTVYAMAIWFAIRAAATSRTPQGAVGWVVFLISMPFVAVPAYLFLGHHRFRGYRIARQESERVVDALIEAAALHAPDPTASSVNLAPFEDIARMPAVRGNGGDLLIDGEASFDAIFAAIDAARDYVLVQFYTVRDDALGRALRDRLVAAAQRGVTVRFVTDTVGSLRLSRRYLDSLRAAGVILSDDSQVRGPKFRFQINYRNHRKTVIVDGTVGFTGGLNVGDEYMGRSRRFGPWRDTFVRMTGPVVSQLQLIFVEDWHWLTEQTLLDDLTWAIAYDDRDMTALLVATGPGDDTETGSLLFFSAIVEARERVWIASPYFVPDIDVMTALKNAVLRGVDVRLLLPGRPDHYMPWLAAHSYVAEAVRAGVSVWRHGDGFMHQKVFVVDDRLAGVGTTNLDNRSFRLNFEAMAVFADAGFATAVAAMLSADFERSQRADPVAAARSPLIRYGAPVARLFAPLL